MIHLSIGTATDRIDLLDKGGFHAGNWIPAAEPQERTVANSALADYKQLVSYRELVTTETIPLTLRRPTQDECVQSTQDLRRMLIKAMDYWASHFQAAPVYLAAQASCETNRRYAIVHSGDVPKDSNPFGEPFLQRAHRAVMELTLIVERGPWTDTVPGDATQCLEISGMSASGYPYYLDFGGNTDRVNCASGASIDNLPSGNFTAEAWIRAAGWGGSNGGRIFDKCDASAATNGWSFCVISTGGLRALGQFAVTDATSICGLDDLSLDGEWHHVVAAFTLASLTFSIAIDGVWVATYDTQAAGVGLYQVDAANDLYIGNSIGQDRGFDGDIGWCRLSTGLRYAVGVNFTAPDRCRFPSQDATDVGLWIKEGTGATAYDYSGSANNGTITGADWTRNDCEMGRAATCNDEVFVTNKHNRAQLTNVHYFDASAGTWSGNLLAAALPYAFMPPAPLQVNDVVVFGSNTATLDSGPFCSLVFDIATALTAGAGITIAWRYSRTGADIVLAPWPALTVTYFSAVTDVFDTAGVASASWLQPADWTVWDPVVNGGAALGVTGYWVAAIVTAAAGAPTPPTQGNRDIYSVLWPYVTIDEADIGGDIPAWLRAKLENKSLTVGPSMVFVGRRQLSRGVDFSAYLNGANEQNPPGVTSGIAGPITSPVNTTAAAGMTALWTAPGAGVLNEILMCSWTLDTTISAQYYGSYRAFLQCIDNTPVACRVFLQVYGGDTWLYESNHTVTLKSATPEIIDLGLLEIPEFDGILERLSIGVWIDAGIATGVPDTFETYQLVLIPVDECALTCLLTDQDLVGGGTGVMDLDNYLDIDSISVPREMRSAPLRNQTTDYIESIWEARINRGRAVLQQNSDQRLWFWTISEWTDTTHEANHEQCLAVQTFRQQRYLSMRGDR